MQHLQLVEAIASSGFRGLKNTECHGVMTWDSIDLSLFDKMMVDVRMLMVMHGVQGLPTHQVFDAAGKDYRQLTNEIDYDTVFDKSDGTITIQFEYDDIDTGITCVTIKESTQTIIVV